MSLNSTSGGMRSTDAAVLVLVLARFGFQCLESRVPDLLVLAEQAAGTARGNAE